MTVESDKQNLTDESQTGEDSDWRPITSLRRHGHKAYVEFGQRATAQDVVKLLQADESIAIALAGDYGSGKSEVLHQVELEISANGDPAWHIIKYTPWRYAPNETTLRRTFLNQVIRGTPSFAGKPELIKPRPETLELKAVQPREVTWRETVHVLTRPMLIFLALSIVALALWAFLAIGASTVGFELPNGVAVVLAFAVAMATAFGDKLIRQTYDLHFETVRRHESVQTTEIDDFEANYAALLQGLRKANRFNRLIVLVDDLDRCREDEIKTVLGGLGTYLGKAPDGNEARVSFVVALDAQRTEDLLTTRITPRDKASDDGRALWGRYNLVGKHFDAIVPVPIPSLEQWKKILAAHALELNWCLNDERVDRLARMSAIASRFNLRELQSSIVEAQLIRWHWQADREAIDSNIAAILSDDLLLFQSALLRVSVPADKLRSFLHGPIGTAGANLPREAKTLLDPFKEQDLDPRPVLAIGLASSEILQLDDLPSIVEKFEGDDDNQYEEACPTGDLNPDMALRVAYYCTKYVTRTKDASLVQKQVNRIEALLDRADVALSNTPEEVEGCLDWYNEMRLGVFQQNKPGAPEIKRWICLAYRAGSTVLKQALAEGRITWDHGNSIHSLEEATRLFADEAAGARMQIELGSVIVAAARIAASNAQQKQKVASALGLFEKISNRANISGLGALVVHLLKDWDIAAIDVPGWLTDREAVRAIETDGVQQDAALIQAKSARVDDPHDVFDRMMKAGWGAFADHLTDEGDVDN